MKICPNTVLLIGCLLCSPVRGREGHPERTGVMIDLSDVTATNMSPLSKYVQGRVIDFTEGAPAPPGDGFYFLRYSFNIPRDDVYRVRIQGREPGVSGSSRYSYVVDGGPVREVFYKRLVNGSRERVEGRDALKLGTGNHTVELRFYPAQRLQVMSRIDGKYAGHVVNIKSMGFLPISHEKGPLAPPRTREQALLVKHGDRVVFFGDSITDEEYYPRHFDRIVRKAYPHEEILSYNTGVSGNRIWEGLARIEDVIALKPTWVVTAFGVNDCMHMSPEEFEKTYEKVILRLKKEGIRVLCMTPSGLLPGRERSGKYFHTPDRAGGFDRTMAYEARVVVDLASKYDCLLSDSLCVLSHCGIPREQLMGNQWHPNTEGGRLMALSILRELGLSKADVAKSQDPRDVEYFEILQNVPKVEHPRHQVETRLPSDLPEGDIIVVSSYTDNAVYVFSAENGKEVACVPVGHHPMGMAYSQKRQELYVACEGVGKIDVISISDFKLKGPIDVGDIYPLAIELTMDENTAWTGNYWAASVTEIDLNERKVKRSIPTGAAAFVESILLLETQNLLLAGTKEGLVAVNTSTGNVVKSLPLDYIGGFVKGFGGVIGAIDTGDWKTHTLSVADLVVKKTAPSPLPARAIVMNEKTGDFWAGNANTHKLVKISKNTGKTSDIADVAFPLGVVIVRADRR